MSAVETRWRELAKTVAYHVLRDVHGNELLAIVHGERQSDEFRSDHGRTAPSFDDLLLTRLIQFIHLPLELVVDERSFF